MKKHFNFKKILIAIAAIVCLIATYFTVVIIKARIDTPKIISQALKAHQVKLEVNLLSKWQLNALLAVEDPKFYHHNGIDLQTPGAGLTTITQGLVKIFYFDHFKPGLAKLKQSLIAICALNPMVAKDDQLKLFINYIYLGHVNGKPIIGFADAAEAYFGKPINQLSEEEYLSIVAMIIAPNNFHIIDRPQANEERTSRIKNVVSGEYQPKQLMDIYYGILDQETQKGLAPASYFPSIYNNN